MKTFRIFISILSALAILFSLASCTTMKPVEGYEEYVEDTDPVFEKVTEDETRNYAEGWPEDVRSYISVYLSEGEYVKTVSNNTANGVSYTIVYNDVPRDDAIAYGREVGIWEEDWERDADNTVSVSDVHKAFSIRLTHYSKPINGYNFTISIKIYNDTAGGLN